MQQEAAPGSHEQMLAMADRCLGRRIARLHRLVSRRFEAELRECGLTHPQLEVLSEMALHGAPARPSEIAGWLGLERSTISRNLDVLTQRGYVHAAATSSAGRTTRVSVTDAGYRALATAAPAWRRAQAWLSEAVDADAGQALDRWLNALDLEPHEK
ncbi:transcriptional regulator slyA [Actinoplanes sp. SE50]|uniref:MarR family winged helix-turn-helix transcriptional regulator n=1 Tax=unclassified Actinoplanes TaxID=2626549 RepID=UPI00023ED459|nr:MULTISPECIES: MarR family winged helix-turn-helix transcriptional regulator [unclassified Actinoplanes]AEV84997.1 Transcriptional regulator slyA [Actinoplanes sp. SE50/110]ATO83388.1 transcriptional regulator slyA [Actinoplanes sp. SE50]SLM00795.1 MarR family transcriptional regulator [Actinoplanes sp. SE50/110]